MKKPESATMLFTHELTIALLACGTRLARRNRRARRQDLFGEAGERGALTGHQVLRKAFLHRMAAGDAGARAVFIQRGVQVWIEANGNGAVWVRHTIYRLYDRRFAMAITPPARRAPAPAAPWWRGCRHIHPARGPRTPPPRARDSRRRARW